MACHLPLGGTPWTCARSLSHIAAHVDMTIDDKSFHSPKLKEISPVRALLLMCLSLPYPALGAELKRDLARSYKRGKSGQEIRDCQAIASHPWLRQAWSGRGF